MLPPDHEEYSFLVSQGGGETMNNAQMKERYPALSGINDNMYGFFSHTAGYVRVKEALQAAKTLAEE